MQKNFYTNELAKTNFSTIFFHKITLEKKLMDIKGISRKKQRILLGQPALWTPGMVPLNTTQATQGEGFLVSAELAET